MCERNKQTNNFKFIPCIPVGVYRTAENTDTNVVEGSFFLASDQSCIYRLDTDTGTVEEVAG